MNKQDLIRNFAIIAHVDHGKSTLSDRLLEITKTIAKDKLQEQFLDQNVISRKRGITIKLAPVRMQYRIENQNSHLSSLNSQLPDSTYQLNLIDTPGHVDFSYEVSRTLAACEGAVLLVDATQGIQAQTVAHYQVARKLGLVMIPVLNKIDLPNAQTETVTKELENFGFDKDEILNISAKTGEGVKELLKNIIEKIPHPSGNPNAPLRALIFDAVYEEYRGTIAYVRIIDGAVKKGDKVKFYQNNSTSDVTEVGEFTPFLKETDSLQTGEIGYLVGSIKEIKKVRVGDTIITAGSDAKPLQGYTIPQPMVFFGLYPKDTNDFVMLRESLGKLTLNDTALTYTEEYSAYLGSGFRVGFLGLLHADIVKERLKQEFDLDLLLTMPQVLYDKRDDGDIFEPYMNLVIYTPSEYVGNVMTISQKKKGNLLDVQYHDAYATLTYEMPYSMFIRGLSAEIKSGTSGFGSIDYELSGYKKADLVQLDILINGNVIDVLSELVYKDEAIYVARAKAEKLKESLDRAQFRQIIQATVNNAIVAREEIPPYRKDVLAKMSGGDVTRKNKLLDKQKKGKKKMLSTGKVQLSQDALFSMITES
jgi:GTP-binding protein LepA